MEKNNIKLICTPLTFYSPDDEELFFDWLNKIEAIEEIKGVGPELHLCITSPKISDEDLCNLFGVFNRYQFDKKQLQIFKNAQNKSWFDSM